MTDDFSSHNKLSCEAMIICKNDNNGAKMGHWRMEAEEQHEGCAVVLYSSFSLSWSTSYVGNLSLL